MLFEKHQNVYVLKYMNIIKAFALKSVPVYLVAKSGN